MYSLQTTRRDIRSQFISNHMALYDPLPAVSIAHLSGCITRTTRTGQGYMATTCYDTTYSNPHILAKVSLKEKRGGKNGFKETWYVWLSLTDYHQRPANL